MTITKSKKARSDELWGTLFAGIPVLGLIIFTYIPLLMAVVMSFMEVPGLTLQGAKFFPLKQIFTNYVTVIRDGYFWRSILNNIVLMIGLPISIILSIAIAELLTKGLRGTRFFKVLLFVPYVCSVTATTFMWNWLLNYDHGVINSILGKNINWFGPDLFIWSVMIMTIWASCGYRILLFTAAMTNVNSSLKEAAAVDGANKFQIFGHVTLPSITPTIFYILVMGTIGVLQEFTRIQVLDSTGAKCTTVVFYVYKKMLVGTPDAGVGCAASIILALLVALLTKLHFTISKKWVSYDAS